MRPPPEWVSNTSPILHLHRIARLELLPAVVGTLTVPEAVASEFEEGRTRYPDLPDLRGVGWVRLRAAAPEFLRRVPESLGPGERATIALALELSESGASSIALIDERRGRNVARELGVRVHGLMRLLLDAKARGILSRVDEVLDRLESAGFRVDPATRRLVLEWAGELRPL